jgi:hypothetical protein
MTNQELKDRLLKDANDLVSKANELLELSRSINPNPTDWGYMDDADADRDVIRKLKDRLLTYIDYKDEVSAKDISERFDLPVDYPSFSEKNMMLTYALLKELVDMGYLIRDASETPFVWRITIEGREMAKLHRQIEQHPFWDELYF